ncbi:ROK family protein [Flindersiella endophytica]
MRPEAADLRAIRTHNLRAVAELVRSRGQVARREIADTLAINKVTVSSLAAELISLGLLELGERLETSRPGRPSRALRVDQTVHASIVAEILPDQVRLSAWSLSIDQLELPSLGPDIHPVREGQERTVPAVAKAVGKAATWLSWKGRRVVGVMAAVPGLVDAAGGQVDVSEPLSWHDAPLVDLWGQRANLRDVPIVLGRIANLATIAEWRHQPEAGDLLCLHGGETGIGAGVVVNGTLLSGSRGRAGELAFGGPPHLGLSELLETAKLPADATVDDLVERLDAEDRLAWWAVRELAERLAKRLAALTALLDPSAVVLAGYFPPLEPYLRPFLLRELGFAIRPRPEAGYELRSGAPDAARVGGAILLADRAFERLDSRLL